MSTYRNGVPALARVMNDVIFHAATTDATNTTMGGSDPASLGTISERGMTASKYRTIVADPPWHYDGTTGVNRGVNAGNRKPVLSYDTMDLADMTDLLVEAWAENDAHLLLWTTNRYVLAAYHLAESWGFRPSTLLTWCKKPVGIGPGGVFALTTEFVLYARKGHPEHLQRVGSNWWEWPRGAHSEKPAAFLDMVEATFPGPYLEMFARRARFGWDYWGDESLGTAEMPA